MNLLSPFALIWLGSIPLLLWLWRLASTKRQIRVASLVPFEHLLRRAPRARTRLVITALFWLQLAALLALALALARPVWFQPHAHTVLALLDTSASMGASRRGPSAFAEAKRALLARVARKAPTDQLFIVTTSPVQPLMPQPTSDAVALSHAIRELRVSDLGGNLSTTARIGRALLTTEPDETVVITDEVRPETLGEHVEWITVGAASANVAIVGLDTQGPLCSTADASVVATVQNFSDEAVPVTIAASQRGRRLAEQRTTFDPQGRQAIPLAIPEGTEGWVEISLRSQGDSLAVDNRAWVPVRRSAARPVVVRSTNPAFTETVSAWLEACEALAWTTNGPVDSTSVLITDQPDGLASAAAALVFTRPPRPQPMPSYWVISAGHPIGAYLAPIDVVAASLAPSFGTERSGIPVVSALVAGRKIPVLIADEREGRRMVSLRLDPSASRTSTPVLLAFLNSLRWLMGRTESQTTGEPLVATGFTSGRVSVRRPDGVTERVESAGGAFVYDAAVTAGLYRFSQGGTEVTVAVNFFDPLESNLLERTSTWSGPREPSARSSVSGRVSHPLANLLIMLILAVLLIEWWRYSLKGRSTLA